MSRIPQPTTKTPQKWRPDLVPADYSDEVTDRDLEALRRISEKEVSDEEFDLVDGPAW